MRDAACLGAFLLSYVLQGGNGCLANWNGGTIGSSIDPRGSTPPVSMNSDRVSEWSPGLFFSEFGLEVWLKAEVLVENGEVLRDRAHDALLRLVRRETTPSVTCWQSLISNSGSSSSSSLNPLAPALPSRSIMRGVVGMISLI